MEARSKGGRGRAMTALAIERLQLGPMQNFVYLLTPTVPGRLAVVDPGWDSQAILSHVEGLGRTVTDIILTHHHEDHRNAVEALLAVHPARVHVHKAERPWLKGLGWLTDCVLHDGGDVVELGGAAQVRLIHTPGHTPGSQCLLAGDRLLTGDSLFIDGCGRCDLPGGDAASLFQSLHKTLGALPGTTRVLPGHDYGPVQDATLDEQKASNPYLKLQTVADFVAYRMRLRT